MLIYSIVVLSKSTYVEEKVSGVLGCSLISCVCLESLCYFLYSGPDIIWIYNRWDIRTLNPIELSPNRTNESQQQTIVNSQQSIVNTQQLVFSSQYSISLII